MKLVTAVTTFIIIVLCELGDKTQVATLVFASNNPSKRWQVFPAAAAALVCCVIIEVTIGASLARIISPSTINRVTGAIFIAIGAFTMYGAFRRKSSSTGKTPASAPSQSKGLPPEP